MRRAKKAFLFMAVALSACAIGAWVFLRPPSYTVIDGRQALEFLKPFQWIKLVANLETSSFSLKDGEIAINPMVPFKPESEQSDFVFDHSEFISLQGAKSFREAQLNYKSSDQAPRVKSWGPLPYPPLKRPVESSEPAHPFRESPLSKPAYQVELDRTTGTELTANERVELFQNGQAKKPMKEVVDHASSFLFINMLSIACDEATEELIVAIEKKARQGVDTRVVIHKTYSLLSRACLKRLRDAGVTIVKAMAHSSYIVNDKSEAVIGSQSIARMFFNSTGYNFLDRDMMLAVRGPVASDILRDFLSLWDENRAKDDKGIATLVKVYKEKVASEIRAGTRGDANYQKWLAAEPKALCRFASQKPEQRQQGISNLLLSLIASARHKIIFSGVKVGPTAVLTALQEKARHGLAVDFMGNGWQGGNGELTMVLDELIEKNRLSGNGRLAEALDRIRLADMRSQARERYSIYDKLTATPRLTVWNHFNFIHYKAWSFDHHGVWISSANTNEESLSDFYESGVLCLDTRLARSFAEQLSLDRANSVPYSPKH